MVTTKVSSLELNKDPLRITLMLTAGLEPERKILYMCAGFGSLEICRQHIL